MWHKEMTMCCCWKQGLEKGKKNAVFKVTLAISSFISVGLSHYSAPVIKQATIRLENYFLLTISKATHNAGHWVQTRESYEICQRSAWRAKSKATVANARTARPKIPRAEKTEKTLDSSRVACERMRQQSAMHVGCARSSGGMRFTNFSWQSVQRYVRRQTVEPLPGQAGTGPIPRSR